LAVIVGELVSPYFTSLLAASNDTVKKSSPIKVTVSFDTIVDSKVPLDIL